MNERIRELVEQAFLTVDGPETFKPSLRQPLIDGLEDLFQEFAELLIRECMEQIDDGNSDHAGGNIDAINRIKEHFGVEE